MPPDLPWGSGLWPSILQYACACPLTRQCPSTSKVNENPDWLILDKLIKLNVLCECSQNKVYAFMENASAVLYSFNKDIFLY